MSKTRTDKRSRSGADKRCPECLKKLRGTRGLIMHMVQEHNASDETIAALKEAAKAAAKAGVA